MSDLWSKKFLSWSKNSLNGFSPIFGRTMPIDLRLVGRTLLHSALVGLAAGAAGIAFFSALEWVQELLLEGVAGYAPLRAFGESPASDHAAGAFHPWILFLLPALGGLACGLLTRFAPETRGGGADATIHAFHSHGGMMRRRVASLKWIASLITLGTGGSGGREGPTMQIGGALGSLVGRWLGVNARERRILLVAGVAAGISAVFRTPLGAALLAVEMLYRDGFEAEALIPSILASVVAYSMVIVIYGESTLFGHVPHFPFVPAHLPLFALLAFLVVGLAIVFAKTLKVVRRISLRLPIPDWARPGLGGLAVGAFAAVAVTYVGDHIHSPGQGLGILGGGYGAVQMAISGSPWLPEGWNAVGLLLLLSLAKIVATSLTVGSGGSAGDFAPALAIGGLFGGAFGRAAELLLADPRIDPGAFALVGMGAFYGGIAHVPLSALVLVCELAGNYDLLVPLMLALGVAFVAARNHTLYEAQPATQSSSPVHRDDVMRDALRDVRVATVTALRYSPQAFELRTGTAEMLRMAADCAGQDVYPVVNPDGRMMGIVTSASLHVLGAEHDDARWILAIDIMQPPVSVSPEDSLRTAAEQLITNGLREIPVVDGEGRVIALLDEAGIAQIYLEAARRAEENEHA